jgi:uncharacterized protein (UPF0276 family)
MNPAVGLGFKADHFDEAIEASAAGLWFEVHAENYMVDGGPRLAMLEALRERYELSLHGVGLSLAGFDRPDAAHLAAFRRLIDSFDPALVSEHLAWSRHGGECFPDLLPFARTNQSLGHVCRNISLAQDALGRAILIENPSHYMPLKGHSWSEPEFLAEIVRRTDCGLLLDLANVHVSSANLGFSASDYLAALPAAAVGEIHLAGPMPDAALDLLIDGHCAPPPEPVIGLLERFVRQHGIRPALIEWDRQVPPFAKLMTQRDRIAAVMAAALTEIDHVEMKHA